MKLSASHLRRYKDLAFLFFRHGRGDLARHVRQLHADFPSPEPVADDPTDGTPASADDGPERLAADLERMGPTYIKLGQVLAGRPDILPPAYQTALARLQDKIAPFPFEEVERIVFSELGVRISKAFAEFDPVPVAAASLGQVHRATLRDGRAVVVKIQRPGIRQIIAEDFEVLADIADLLDKHTESGRIYHFAKLLEQFRITLRDELNYEQEASNLEIVGKNLGEFKRIHVPRPIHDYCSPIVLTMEYMEGCKITALSPLSRIDLDGAGLADELLRAYLKQVLVDGVFHADPHPGNLFITPDHHLALLDLGMVGRLPPGLQDNLLKLLIHVTEGRGEEAVAALREIAPAPASAEIDSASLDTAVTQLVARHRDGDLQDLNVGRSVLMLDHHARAHGLQPPPELSLLGKTLLQLDEAGRTLDPAFKPSDSIRRHLGALMTSRIRENLTQGSLFGALLEAKNFAAGLPGRLTRVLDNLGNPRFEITVKSDDTSRLLEGMQKIANRISAGIVLAALIMGAALLMRVDTPFRVLGYPGLAMICFGAAAAGGAWLVISTFLHDASDQKKRRAP
ncbi:MAG: AarF/ABC1/UbiB kinase family protein [Burkholderiales bacterium]|nr:AarF/ABC1/UbiB kinase family protein [Opitutaceae bacterium]